MVSLLILLDYIYILSWVFKRDNAGHMVFDSFIYIDVQYITVHTMLMLESVGLLDPW